MRIGWFKTLGGGCGDVCCWGANFNTVVYIMVKCGGVGVFDQFIE